MRDKINLVLPPGLREQVEALRLTMERTLGVPVTLTSALKACVALGAAQLEAKYPPPLPPEDAA
jgi:hypothetical protein